jgi:transposase
MQEDSEKQPGEPKDISEEEAKFHALIVEQSRSLRDARRLESAIEACLRRIAWGTDVGIPVSGRLNKRGGVELRSRFLGLLAQGHEVGRVASALGVSSSTAYVWTKKHRNGPRPRRITKQRKAILIPRLLDLLAQGQEMKTAATSLGIPEDLAYRLYMSHLRSTTSGN